MLFMALNYLLLRFFQKNLRLLTTLVIALFIFIGVFGLSMSMPTDKHGMMTSCPFMINKSSICNMSATDHIAKWQQMFTTTLQSSNLFLLALVAVAFIYVSLKRQTDLRSSSYYAHRYYLYKNPEVKLFNYLTQAFSDGILHPKIYA